MLRPFSVGSAKAVTSMSASETQKSLPLPDKPPIAVLPFDNMRGDPEQEYFSDGITEDIITALAKNRWLSVTARNSTFAYKGQIPVEMEKQLAASRRSKSKPA